LVLISTGPVLHGNNNEKTNHNDRHSNPGDYAQDFNSLFHPYHLSKAGLTEPNIMIVPGGGGGSPFISFGNGGTVTYLKRTRSCRRAFFTSGTNSLVGCLLMGKFNFHLIPMLSRAKPATTQVSRALLGRSQTPNDTIRQKGTSEFSPGLRPGQARTRRSVVPFFGTSPSLQLFFFCYSGAARDPTIPSAAAFILSGRSMP
jgi:hypothetical protein